MKNFNNFSKNNSPNLYCRYAMINWRLQSGEVLTSRLIDYQNSKRKSTNLKLAQKLPLLGSIRPKALVILPSKCPFLALFITVHISAPRTIFTLLIKHLFFQLKITCFLQVMDNQHGDYSHGFATSQTQSYSQPPLMHEQNLQMEYEQQRKRALNREES